MPHRVTKVTVRDPLQSGYTYERTEPVGKHFHPDFTPQLTPKQMLKLGVFGGAYLREVETEFPANWFTHAKITEGKPDKTLNYFGVHASQSRAIWKAKGWIHKDDPRGWFQWYCRYYMGRRIPKEDERQIRRWKAIRRHASQIMHNCMFRDLVCRPRQRQLLLHWAYDSRKI